MPVLAETLSYQAKSFVTSASRSRAPAASWRKPPVSSDHHTNKVARSRPDNGITQSALKTRSIFCRLLSLDRCAHTEHANSDCSQRKFLYSLRAAMADRRTRMRLLRSHATSHSDASRARLVIVGRRSARGGTRFGSSAVVQSERRSEFERKLCKS